MQRLRSCLYALAAVIVACATVTPAALAQGALVPQDTSVSEPPQAVPHVVLPDVDSLTITWTSQEPARGVVLYGLSPSALTNVVSEADGDRVEHSVTIGGLSPSTLVYYLISNGAAPAGKDGQPYHAETNAAEIAPASTQATEVTDASTGVHLTAPAGWSLSESPESTAAEPVLDVEGPTGALLVTRQPANGLDAEHWFAAHRADYHPTLVQPVGTTTVAGSQALIVAQPDSCITQAMLVAFIPGGDQMWVATYLEGANRTEAPEFVEMLSSFSTGGDASPVDARFGVFPAAPPLEECGELEASVQIASSTAVSPTITCPGAAMAIPAPGANQLPWGCFEYDPICRPYSKTSTYGSYFRLPHRGTDLAGVIGETPVYATFAGTAVKLYASNIRISFSAPYTGKSVWMAHMASFDGRTDYRLIVSGQKVTTGQHIGYTGYYNTSGNPPHLHITYANNSYGTETWPTIDPTRMLSVKDAVWYDGWNAIKPLECSAVSADAFEPDNFNTVAPLVTTDGALTHHDFHAPGDEDWVKFTTTAGKSYAIETSGLGSRSDTSVAIISTDGKSVIAQNDDVALDTLASRVVWQAAYSGTYYVRVRHYSYNGYEPFRPQPTFTNPIYGPDTGYDLSVREFIPNILYAKPAGASSYDASIPAKASYAIDSDMSTSWASEQNPRLPQWWWAQADYLRFNRVDIYWNAPYAARYFIGWSNDNVTYTGYTYTLTEPGAFSHSMLALRTAKYIGIRMEALAAGQTSFSMREVAAYRMPTVSAASEADGPGDLVELQPDGDEVTYVHEGIDASFTLFLPTVTTP